MKKWLLGLPLVLISVFIWLPLWMLISGTFMGGAELSEILRLSWRAGEERLYGL